MRAWLISLVLACLVPGMVGAALLFEREYRNNHERLERNTILTARALIQTVDSHLFTARAVAQTLSTAGPLAIGDFEQFHRRARRVLSVVGPGSSFILSDPSGQQIVNTVVEYGHPLPRHSSPDLVQQVFNTGSPVISDLITSLLVPRPTVSVHVPVVIHGKVAYVLSLGLPPDQFNAILRAQGLPPEWVAAVFDSSGTIVARTHAPERYIGRPGATRLLEHMQRSSEGTLDSVTRDGIPVLGVYSRSQATAWAVAIGIPRQHLDASLGRSVAFLALGMLALFAIGVGLALIMGGRIARSIQALIGPATALGAGQAVAVPRVHAKEAAEVARAISRAAIMLRERTQALEESIAERRAAQAEAEESRARLAAILHSLKEGVVVFDLEGTLLQMNPMALLLHGYMDPFEVHRGLAEFAEVFEVRSPEGDALPKEEWPLGRVLRGESFTEQVVELRRKGDGRSRIMSYSGTPVWDDHGHAILGVLTMRDVTERRQAEAEIQRLNAELENRVRQRTAELERSNEALLRSNMELQRFAHAAAHDLQTPLRSIASFAQLLQREMRDCLDPRADEWLTLVVDNARRLQNLIRELLAYSRLEAQARPFEATDLGEVCDQVIASLAAPIGEAGAEVGRGDLPTLPVDRTEMAQLLQNLIENGIKYNRSTPPRVTVGGEHREGEWVFSVADNGIGIDPKHHERIFEIFRRLHTYTDVPGTGIGLAICQRIVERHGGRIWVESEPGRGSVFYFTLPERPS
ncbi:MAG TPA: ATP-binding protein [Rhodocyclaceae bacterium]|nr:ATP-binding protein [Rhodocyclaceae bacterium]